MGSREATGRCPSSHRQSSGDPGLLIKTDDRGEGLPGIGSRRGTGDDLDRDGELVASPSEKRV